MPAAVGNAIERRREVTEQDPQSRVGLAEAAPPFVEPRARIDACDLGAAASFDETDVKDPVVEKVAASDYRMLYTGVETLDGKTIERT